MRRKALVIMSFETPDAPLKKAEKGWNQHFPKDPQIRPTVSSDFLIVRDKQHKRPGFLEIELKPGESPMAGLRRLNPWSADAITKPWQQVDIFPYTENDNHWEVLVGIIGMHADQRQVDLYEQSDELPFTVEWQTPHWLFRQNEDNFLSYITSIAIARPKVRESILATQQRRAA